MANDFDPQEFQAALEAYENEIRTLGKATAETTALYLDAKNSMKQWQAQVDASWKKLGSSATGLAKGLYKGEKGAGVFGDAVDTAATALQTLILLIPGIGIAAKVAAFAIGTFGKAVSAASKQGDALFKTYQDLNKVGATTAGGMQDVFLNMQKFGYGIEELDKMVALVAANSETLAKFSLTAADGANAFANSMQSLTRDQGLREMGKTVDDINQAGAAYIRQQVAAGRSQRNIGDTLGASTKEYIRQLDTLQRLTGTSAEQLQKQQDEAMAEDAYNDVMAELQQRATAGDEVAKEQIKKIGTTMANLSPEMQKQFQRSIGGDISAQQQMFMRMPSLMRNVMDESVGVGQTMRDAKKDIDTYVDTFGRSYRLNAEGMREFGGSLRSAREEALQFGDFDERTAAANKNAVVTDKGTKSMAELQLSQMSARDALQSMVQMGVAPATIALSKLAGAAGGAAGGAARAVGAPSGGGGAGGGGWLRDMLGIGAPAGGLRIKSGEATAGGAHSDSLTALAQNIQSKLGGDLKYFSAFNDTYHQGLDRNSAHKSGRALDFTLTDPSKAAEIAQLIQSMPGVSKVINEYAKLSSGGTGGHIHAEVSMASGGIASGPRSGYQAMLHGTEAVVPLPDGKTIPVEMPGISTNLADQTSLMAQQLSKLDELVRVMQNQVSLSNKILQQAS